MDDHEITELAEAAAKPVVRVFFVFCLLFGVVNWAAMTWGSPEAFQRLGALWVAILILIFGYSKILIFGLKSISKDSSELSTFTFANQKNRLLNIFAPSDSSVSVLKDPEQRRLMNLLVYRLENRLAVRVFSGEIILLVMSTLQWGYGDLLHCWAGGRGWKVC